MFYKHFQIMLYYRKLQQQYLIQPYKVGKHKKSLAMILPSEIVKTLQIDPLTILLLLKVKGIDEIQLKIIREEDLAKKDTENRLSAEKVSEARSADIIPISKSED
jgi:hypothetical protein